MYIRAFVKIYNQRKRRQVQKTHCMIQFENYPILRSENSSNLDAHQYFKISEILQNTYIIPRDIKDKIFYVNNYIAQDQFNQLYDPKQQTKKIQITNLIVQKLMLALRKRIEQRQEAEIRVAWNKKAPKRIDSSLSDEYKHDDYDINESQDTQSNNKTNPDEMDNLNID